MSVIEPYLPFLLRGLLITLEVTGLGVALALLVAFTAGLSRMSRHRAMRWPASTFIEVFRGTSMIVQLFWFFYALPFFGIQLTPLAAAVLTLGLNEGAYAAEIVRGAMLSLPVGQTDAAVALNMTVAQRYRLVLLPQAIPRMLPPFGNVVIDLLKNSSLVSLVTVADLTFRAQQVRATTGATTEVFGVIMLAYFVVSVLLSFGRRGIERKVRPEPGAKWTPGSALRLLVLGNRPHL
ncbi:MAG: ectoine/hydroxyectoine ABC transporter permease subunit EhuC [Streptosporangiales bacterium]